MKNYERLASSREFLDEEIRKEDVSFRTVLFIFVVTVVARVALAFSERGTYGTYYNVDSTASAATIWDVIVASLFLIIFMRSFSVRSTLNALRACEFRRPDKDG